MNNPNDHSLGILIGLSLNLRKMIPKREIERRRWIIDWNNSSDWEYFEFSQDSCESEFEKSISSKKDKEYRTK